MNLLPRPHLLDARKAAASAMSSGSPKSPSARPTARSASLGVVVLAARGGGSPPGPSVFRGGAVGAGERDLELDQQLQLDREGGGTIGSGH